MQYDERIKADKLKEQLIITPYIDFDYEYVTKKNVFKITFDEHFQDSITYTLNFRESIQDITESNPSLNNKYTFSTGNFIDSMSIKGFVKDLVTYDTLKNILVGLYKAKDTITIQEGSPYYFTEAIEDGSYLIENVKNGQYLLYAFNDENKNLKLETNKETYGFSRDTLLLDSDTVIKNIDLIRLDLTDFKMNSSVISGKNFDINFNKYITEFTLNPIDTNYNIFANLVKENKTIRIYNTYTAIDSIQLVYSAIDSINSLITDTLYANFSESKRKPDDLTFKVLPESNSSIDPQFEIKINFNKPITTTNNDSIFLQYDTTRILNIHDSLFHWNKTYDKLSFEITIDKNIVDTIITRKNKLYELQKDSLQTISTEQTEKRQINKGNASSTKKINQGLHLYIGNASFLSVEKDTSLSASFNYKFVVPEENGIQNITIETDYQSFTIQLLDKDFKIIQEVTNSKSIQFKNIKPGKYKIRVLIDKNNDGFWSPGNMIKRIEPEPVYIYPDQLIIRADWQTTLSLKF